MGEIILLKSTNLTKYRFNKLNINLKIILDYQNIIIKYNYEENLSKAGKSFDT